MHQSDQCSSKLDFKMNQRKKIRDYFSIDVANQWKQPHSNNFRAIFSISSLEHEFDIQVQTIHLCTLTTQQETRRKAQRLLIASDFDMCVVII